MKRYNSHTPWKAVKITESCDLCWMITDANGDTVVDGIDEHAAEYIVDVINKEALS